MENGRIRVLGYQVVSGIGRIEPRIKIDNNTVFDV